MSEVTALVSLSNYPTSLDAAAIQRVADLMLTGGLLARHLAVAPLLFR